MSERRRLESTIRDASFRVEEAARELKDAREYLDSHEFLQDANPPLAGNLGVLIDKLDSMQGYLWNLQVQS